MVLPLFRHSSKGLNFSLCKASRRLIALMRQTYHPAPQEAIESACAGFSVHAPCPDKS
jgi:hypothetical protein